MLKYRVILRHRYVLNGGLDSGVRGYLSNRGLGFETGTYCALMRGLFSSSSLNVLCWASQKTLVPASQFIAIGLVLLRARDPDR